MRVKICGITRAEDVRIAVEAGADAVGFVNVPGGPRYVEAARIADLAALVPPFVTPVAVVDLTDPLDEARMDALRFLLSRGIRTIQFHGHEPPWEVGRLKGLHGFTALKAIRLRHRRDLDMVATYRGVADAVVADGGAGQGLACDWDLAAEAASDGPLVLAGGLAPENVAAAIRRVRPHAVDCASGVERAPGIKDPDRVRAFIVASRSAIDPLTTGA